MISAAVVSWLEQIKTVRVSNEETWRDPKQWGSKVGSACVVACFGSCPRGAPWMWMLTELFKETLVIGCLEGDGQLDQTISSREGVRKVGNMRSLV